MKTILLFCSNIFVSVMLSLTLTSTRQVYANWVAKINQDFIYTKDFQQFIDIQKNNLGQKNTSLNTEVQAGISLGEMLLEKYIDNQIILIEAKKKGYTKNKKSIQQLFSKQRDTWLANYFINQQIDTSKVKVGEKDINKFYNIYKNKAKQSGSKIEIPDYKDLQSADKYKLLEAAKLEAYQKYQKLRRAYFAKLEKKYKIKYYKLNKKVVAKVGKTSITKKEVEAHLARALKLLGISKNIIAKQKPKEYNDLQEEVRTKLVANILTKYEIKAQRFESKTTTKNALEYFFNDLILNAYIKEEIFNKIKVSEQEIETAFQRHKDALRKQKWTLEQIETRLKESIRKEKGQAKILKLIKRKKEESIIRRNEKEINKAYLTLLSSHLHARRHAI